MYSPHHTRLRHGKSRTFLTRRTVGAPMGTVRGGCRGGEGADGVDGGGGAVPEPHSPRPVHGRPRGGGRAPAPPRRRRLPVPRARRGLHGPRGPGGQPVLRRRHEEPLTGRILISPRLIRRAPKG